MYIFCHYHLFLQSIQSIYQLLYMYSVGMNHKLIIMYKSHSVIWFVLFSFHHFHAGTIILFEDYNWDNPDGVARRRRQTGKRQQSFTHEVVPNPLYFSHVDDCDLFGYAVTSGRFLSQDKILYAGGAPRGADSYGKARYSIGLEGIHFLLIGYT